MRAVKLALCVLSAVSKVLFAVNSGRSASSKKVFVSSLSKMRVEDRLESMLDLSFCVAVMGHTKIQIATEMMVPNATMENVSVMMSKSNSASFPDPSLTMTVNKMMNASPDAADSASWLKHV